MPRIYVEFAHMKQLVGSCKTVSEKIDGISSDFKHTVRQLDWDIKYQSDINNTANQLALKLDRYVNTLKNYQSFINFAYNEYVKLDSEKFEISELSLWEKFQQSFSDNFGWHELLAGAGYIGSIYDLFGQFKSSKSWADWAKNGIDVYQFMSGAAKTFSNYKKIGNAVGTKTAMAWWAKSITGLKPLGRASAAKNPITRFANNLTNKTSPFNAQFKNVVDTFKGAKGASKAVAAWGAVAVSGAINYFDNRKEQADSGGKMSDGRVIAETITETAVGTALAYGTGIVVGAAVTAVAGTVAAPGIAVVAATGLVVSGVNAGVEALTGKTTTEWVSDAILDGCEVVGKAAKNVKKSVGDWFSRIF